MRIARFLIGLCCLFALAACAGVGIVASSDPLRKLNDAEDLFDRQDRPLPAERLIKEAMAIYEDRNDAHGLGNAHREYGDLLKSPAVAKWEKAFRRDGFRDKSVTFDNRVAKASEYYSKALEFYARAEKQHIKASKFDALTNVYVNMSWSYLMLGERAKACDYLAKSLDAYAENIRRNPNAKPFSPRGAFPESVEAKKKYIGCV